jgi:NADPH-dependent 2,4-dienoyl-CoA reductase/sulfur reductase-like enzyme
VNPARKSLAMQSGGEFRFEKLIVATGSRVRTLDISGAQIASVQYLRSLDDSEERDVAPKWIESASSFCRKTRGRVTLGTGSFRDPSLIVARARPEEMLIM